MPITTTTPTELLERAAGGHADAWAELLRRYTPLLRSRAANWRLQEADVHDVMQTTWMRLAEHIDDIRNPDQLPGWLATVVTRECERLRRQGARVVLAEDAGESADALETGPEQRTVDRDTAEVIHHALEALSPRRRDLLCALFLQERRPYAEVARGLSIPVGSLGPTRARTLLELRRMLESAGVSA